MATRRGVGWIGIMEIIRMGMLADTIAVHPQTTHRKIFSAAFPHTCDVVPVYHGSMRQEHLNSIII